MHRKKSTSAPLAMDTKRLKELAISESGLIFDPTTGYIFTTNQAGAFIINLLREGKGNDEIKTTVSNDYDVNEEIAEKDIIDFFNQMTGFGLIKSV